MIINAILFINRGRQEYDMRIVQDNKKLGFQKKKARVWEKIWVLKKNSEFWKQSEFKKKTLSFEKNLSLKKYHEFWKNLSFKKMF